MEENKNPSSQKTGGGNPGAKRHRPHHHRGGNRNKGQAPTANAQNRVENKTQQNQSSQARQNQPMQSSKGSHRGGRNRHGRRPQESRVYNPYELSKEEQALKDLRAQIVIQPAAEEKEAPAQEPFAAPAELPTDTPVLSFDQKPDTTLLEAFEERESAEKEPEETVPVVGIRFRSVGKTYFFDPGNKTISAGSFAVVETARGPEFGEVVMGNTNVAKSRTVAPLRPVLRIASAEDIAHNEENRKKEVEALDVCREKIAKHELEMKLIDVQYAFDNSKLLFYFSSEGRVDFRELVKDLASTFHTRIELRQIGIRDEAKLLGGIGACGRLLCCSSFLPDFAQVSIKMAKEQNLSLNSTKISGVCGRLMCCLRYESDTYAEEIRKTPPVDATVSTPDGVGRVVSSSPLAGKIRVLLNEAQDAAPKEYHRDQVTVLSTEKRKGGQKNVPTKEDEKEEKSE